MPFFFDEKLTTWRLSTLIGVVGILEGARNASIVLRRSNKQGIGLSDGLLEPLGALGIAMARSAL
ncbi:MAG: hypothetical protein M3R49_12120 [Chloroflexota bacterium]|nr:hypothetical protein [Chloroflexota bacterium]